MRWRAAAFRGPCLGIAPTDSATGLQEAKRAHERNRTHDSSESMFSRGLMMHPLVHNPSLELGSHAVETLRRDTRATPALSQKGWRRANVGPRRWK